MKKLLLIALCIVAVFSLGACSDKKEKAVSTTTTTTTTIPLPAFTETEETKKILNPCEVISIEHVKSVITNPIVRGPLVQNAVAPSKACEWTLNGKDYPRLGVSIALSPTFYDGSEASKIADVALGEKAFIVKDFVTGFGGTSCGQTLIGKIREYSFAVAVCNAKDKAPTSEQLIELATDVVNSLP